MSAADPPERQDSATLSPAEGFVDASVREEFPALRLQWATVATRARDSPPALQRRLAELSNRQRGAGVVAMRTKPVPQAYRSFFRQIGLDPDVHRIPAEQAAVLRLLHGGYRSAGLIADTCLVALIETGVGVWALDADRVAVGGLGIRAATESDGDGVRQAGGYLEPGVLVVADADRAHAVLFGEVIEGDRVRPRTERVALFAVGVDGVPQVHIEEALWICLELLE